jgi:uncharacterized protein YbjT (DUF2867 family)
MEKTGKTALVFGPTGAVGRQLLDQLLNDERYVSVVAFSRRPIPLDHPQLEQVIDPLTDLSAIAARITGDELFCCLGTTRKKAGSREMFRRVDLELPVEIASIASSNGVAGCIAVSSIGAGKKGRGFYLDTKTEMEQRISGYHFDRLSFVRPSLLLGERDEFRLSEETGKLLNTLFSWTMIGKLRKYRGIRTDTVAAAMIYIMNLEQPRRTYESNELAVQGTLKG